MAGVCAQRSWDRWRTPRLPRPNPVDSAALPPARQRAATWLSSNRPPPEVSQQQAPGGNPCFLLFQDCHGPRSLGENWGAKRTPGQNLKQTYFLCLEESWSVVDLNGFYRVKWLINRSETLYLKEHLSLQSASLQSLSTPTEQNLFGICLHRRTHLKKKKWILQPDSLDLCYGLQCVPTHHS